MQKKWIKNGCLFKNVKGKIEVTKADETTVEGRFAFTTICSATSKVFTVTDGFFQDTVIALKNKTSKLSSNEKVFKNRHRLAANYEGI